MVEIRWLEVYGSLGHPTGASAYSTRDAFGSPSLDKHLKYIVFAICLP